MLEFKILDNLSISYRKKSDIILHIIDFIGQRELTITVFRA